MNEKEQLIKKSLDLSDQEWEDLGEKARDAILKLADPIRLEDPDESKVKEGRHQLAEGIRTVLSLHDDQYDALPRYQRDGLLKKVTEILG